MGQLRFIMYLIFCVLQNTDFLGEVVIPLFPGDAEGRPANPIEEDGRKKKLPPERRQFFITSGSDQKM